MEMRVQLFLAITFITSTNCHNNLVVDTSSGKIRGYKMTSRGGREFLAFSGVPYAKPPLGILRFEPPQELDKWAGVRDTIEAGPYCLQYSTFEEVKEAFGNEDCLYLSIYTHSKRGRKAVMVHIHGGGYHMGNGQRWTLPQYLMDQDVVVVDVNYRLAFLGFFSFEDREMPGNQGLKDQVMALKWVKQNIAKFGGDPHKVTIFGESAGGGSVYDHTISPMSRGLFHRAIAESGTGYSQWALAPRGYAKTQAERLAKNMGCPTRSTSEAVSCLRNKKGSDIVARIMDLQFWQLDFDMIWPCLEPQGIGAFLSGPVSGWEHQPVPMIIGTTSAEGLIRTVEFLNETAFESLRSEFDRVAPVSLMYNATSSDPAQVTKKVRQFYFSNQEISYDLWFNLTQLYTDSLFTPGIIDGANYHTGDVYFYLFDYIGQYSFEKDANRTIYFGPSHIEEVEFLWQRPWNGNRTFNAEDLKFSQDLVRLWTDFAKFGNPTPRGSKVSWKKWEPKKMNYLHLANSGWTMKDKFAQDRYKFWKSTNFRDKFD